MAFELIAYALLGTCTVFLAWLFLIANRNFQDEKTRQRLFNFRSTLWDRAQNGEIDRDSEAYAILRTTLNGYLRYVHRLSLFQLIAMALYSHLTKSQRDTNYENEFSNALKKLPQDQQEILKETKAKAMCVLVYHLLATSWFVGPLIWLLRLFRHYDEARNSTVTVMDQLAHKAQLDTLARREGQRCIA
jgi:hypothetical protein